ncbi:LOW QUALITY PROTEIN: Pol protein [Phytophthora palmivora]|uniref:Pol protein n=1 Tax=Phytophthora palmivora TaxID=4796 RepID=A0A2P4YFG9_9STRA|nr:LOW QUALITY PROTEIN: Pol protein [Phytophthora palmivora]
MALAHDNQNEYSDMTSRENLNEFMEVLLDTRNLPLKLVSSVGNNNLKHRFIQPFMILGRHGVAYTIDLPKSMATRPTFYVERLKRWKENSGESSPPQTDNSWEPEGRYQAGCPKPVAIRDQTQQQGPGRPNTKIVLAQDVGQQTIFLEFLQL